MKRVVTVNRQLVYTYNLSSGDPLLTSAADTGPLEFRFPVPAADVPDLFFDGADRERAAILKYLDQGERLAVIAHGNTVACRGLLRPEGYVSLEGHARQRLMYEHEAFIHYCRTAEAYRGRQLYCALLTGILSSSQSEGNIDKVTISCHRDNVASIKGIQRAGFKLAQRTTTIGILGGRIGYTFSCPE